MKNRTEKFRRPEIFLQELLRKYAKGQLLDRETNVQPFMRALVLAVDNVGGRLSNPDGSGGMSVGNVSYSAQIGPKNPQNSIKARIISKGFDRFITDSDTRIFWPLVQNDHISMPIKPNEHVYVMFEDEHREHGLWLYKVSGHENVNTSVGQEYYSNDSSKNAMDAFEDNSEQKKVSEDVASDSFPGNINELFD